MVLDILEYFETRNEKQGTLNYLDTKKAFDNFNWIFILMVLEDMKFGENLIKWL